MVRLNPTLDAGSQALLAPCRLFHTALPFNLCNLVIQHPVIVTGCHLCIGYFFIRDSTDDDAGRRDRRDAGRHLLAGMGFLALQDPNITLGSSAVHRLFRVCFPFLNGFCGCAGT